MRLLKGSQKESVLSKQFCLCPDPFRIPLPSANSPRVHPVGYHLPLLWHPGILNLYVSCGKSILYILIICFHFAYFRLSSFERKVVAFLKCTLSIRDVYEELVELINSFKNVDIIKASLVAQMVKRLPAMQETQVQSLGQEDPLEKEMAIHSRTLAWKIIKAHLTSQKKSNIRKLILKHLNQMIKRLLFYGSICFCIKVCHTQLNRLTLIITIPWGFNLERTVNICLKKCAFISEMNPHSLPK